MAATSVTTLIFKSFFKSFTLNVPTPRTSECWAVDPAAKLPGHPPTVAVELFVHPPPVEFAWFVLPLLMEVEEPHTDLLASHLEVVVAKLPGWYFGFPHKLNFLRQLGFEHLHCPKDASYIF